MPRSPAVNAAIVLAVVAVAGIGCGGSSEGPTTPERPTYDPAKPLKADVKPVGRRGAVDVERVTYAAFDDERVPALLATPREGPTTGCLIYLGGVGSKKEEASFVWPGTASLGLSTFTIDARSHGARDRPGASLREAIRDPERLARVVRDSGLDLRRAADFLEDRPECHRRIGFLGVSLGAFIGTPFSASDPRVNAAVIMSVPASWRATIESTDIVLPEADRSSSSLRRAVDTMAPYDPDRWISRLAPRPVLLVNGKKDPVVPLASARRLARDAREPKEVVVHDGGHDPFAGPQGARVSRDVARFLRDNLIN